MSPSPGNIQTEIASHSALSGRPRGLSKCFQVTLCTCWPVEQLPGVLGLAHRSPRESCYHQTLRSAIQTAVLERKLGPTQPGLLRHFLLPEGLAARHDVVSDLGILDVYLACHWP